ncbi:hypothetical protein A6R68_02725 [Neotoma lepida]|uniref:Uncharacterized protein n=1 Tax=Neotoma lepida TaxID=56216 RepID=A0A1A6GTR9_NEOLE|nr:hypothetical protein A6R68_02725 [Neotoma lepida]
MSFFVAPKGELVVCGINCIGTGSNHPAESFRLEGVDKGGKTTTQQASSQVYRSGLKSTQDKGSAHGAHSLSF